MKLSRYIFVIYLSLLLAGVGCQPKKPTLNPVTVYKNPKDSTSNFYIKTAPNGPVKGLLVIVNAQLSDSARAGAYNMGIMTLTATPVSNSLDLLIGDKPLDTLDNLIAEVVTYYHIPPNKIVIGGMSAEGTGAVRYVQYCVANKSKAGIRPAGIFAVDPPLDYERLWHESEHGVERNFSPNAVDEGKFVMSFLNGKLGGTPYDHIDSYRAASPYSHSAKNGGNASLLNRVPIKIYVEPNIEWWIENRRKDYYDLNVVDQAALINQLRLNGNSNAELIATSNKGRNPDGSYHPHSWSILNEKELLKWCLSLFH